MLKVLLPANLSNQAKVKCGEIFSHSFTDYTIYCTFCELKSFKFEDFLLHIQNAHLEDNLPESESMNTVCNQYLEVSVKNEVLPEDEHKVSWDSLEQSFDDTDDSLSNTNNCDNDSNVEEEPAMILKKTQKKVAPRKKKKTKLKSDTESNEYDGQSSDDDFKPVVKNKYKTPANVIKSCNSQGLCKIVETMQAHDENPKVKKKEKEIVEYSCPECREIFQQLKHLDRHVFDFHNGYKCSMCDKRFKRRPALAGHEKTHTAEKKFTCPMEKCGRGFTDEEYLKRHLEVHTMERTFICDFENCGKAFHTKRRLNTHAYTHRIPKKLVCDLCGYSCRGNTELMTHQRVHTGEKPFPCEVCDKPFISKTALKEHMITHSTTRPHICQICNASFANPRVLIRHSYIHSDERTFKCKLCDSAFKHPNSLDGHMRRMHRPPKPKSAIAVTPSSYTYM